MQFTFIITAATISNWCNTIKNLQRRRYSFHISSFFLLKKPTYVLTSSPFYLYTFYLYYFQILKSLDFPMCTTPRSKRIGFQLRERRNSQNFAAASLVDLVIATVAVATSTEQVSLSLPHSLALVHSRWTRADYWESAEGRWQGRIRPRSRRSFMSGS